MNSNTMSTANPHETTDKKTSFFGFLLLAEIIIFIIVVADIFGTGFWRDSSNDYYKQYPEYNVTCECGYNFMSKDNFCRNDGLSIELSVVKQKLYSYCEICGEEIKGSEYCGNCGNKIVPFTWLGFCERYGVKSLSEYEDMRDTNKPLKLKIEEKLFFGGLLLIIVTLLALGITLDIDKYLAKKKKAVSAEAE